MKWCRSESSAVSVRRGSITISGVPLSFGQLPLKDLHELPPGHRLRIGRQVPKAEQTWPEIFEPAVGDLKDRLRRFRDTLCAAVEQCAGPARPIMSR